MSARHTALRRGLTLGTVTLAISAGLTTGTSTATPPAGPDPGRAAAPALDWVPCPEGSGPPSAMCATARVPLSYRDPAGPQISLALTKRPATDPQHKIGTVFTNPGGPGSRGRIPPRLEPVVSARFDIVGFDPRGTHSSTPITCSDDPADDAKLSPVFPVTEAEEATAIGQVGEVTARCAQHAGPLLGHMSTANVARDLDLLRRAVGDPQLTYVGTSYGTHLGEVYANLFPQRVRAMVLDGVLQPQEWTTGRRPSESAEPYIHRVGPFLGAQTALKTLLRECAAHPQCVFGEPGATEQSLHRKYDDLLAALRRGPVTLTYSHGETEQITYQELVNRMLTGLYIPEAVAHLTPFLQAVYLATQRPAVAPTTAPAHVPDPDPPRFSPADGTTTEETDEPQRAFNTWFNAVACTDSDNPRDPRAVGRYARLAEPSAPGFASAWIYRSLPCASWPVTDPDRYTGPWNRPTANPVLLVGNRLGDPATPYEDAVATSHLLGRARLLTVDIAGHGVAYDGRNQCVDNWLDGYLVSLTLPPAGTVCAAERGPFDPQPRLALTLYRSKSHRCTSSPGLTQDPRLRQDLSLRGSKGCAEVLPCMVASVCVLERSSDVGLRLTYPTLTRPVDRRSMRRPPSQGKRAAGDTTQGHCTPQPTAPLPLATPLPAQTLEMNPTTQPRTTSLAGPGCNQVSARS